MVLTHLFSFDLYAWATPGSPTSRFYLAKVHAIRFNPTRPVFEAMSHLLLKFALISVLSPAGVLSVTLGHYKKTEQKFSVLQESQATSITACASQLKRQSEQQN